MSWKKLLAATAATVMFGAVGIGGCERREAEIGAFDEWDGNRDGFLTEDEVRSRYSMWDRDRDGRVTEAEFEAD